MDIEEFRREIKYLDARLLVILDTRFECVDKISALKEEAGLAICDENREEELLKFVDWRLRNSDYKDSITAIYTDILAHSRDFQSERRKRP